MFVDDLNKK